MVNRTPTTRKAPTVGSFTGHTPKESELPSGDPGGPSVKPQLRPWTGGSWKYSHKPPVSRDHYCALKLVSWLPLQETVDVTPTVMICRPLGSNVSSRKMLTATPKAMIRMAFGNVILKETVEVTPFVMICRTLGSIISSRKMLMTTPEVMIRTAFGNVTLSGKLLR